MVTVPVCPVDVGTEGMIEEAENGFFDAARPEGHPGHCGGVRGLLKRGVE